MTPVKTMSMGDALTSEWTFAEAAEIVSALRRIAEHEAKNARTFVGHQVGDPPPSEEWPVSYEPRRERLEDWRRRR